MVLNSDTSMGGRLDPSSPQPKCFRISNVPREWDERRLFYSLQAFDPSLNNIAPNELKISLYPACNGSGKTALFNVCTANAVFLQDIPERSMKFCTLLDEDTGKAEVVVDSSFDGLTPLNTPDGEICADIVAVTGLGGHAFGSWKNSRNHAMWLQDFLPRDIRKDIRIMTYSYDTRLYEGTGSHYMLDHTRDFMAHLENARRSQKERDRPIIYIAHSLGGILIKQTLVTAKCNSLHRHILDSSRAILLFGTPHQGLRVEELNSLVLNELSNPEPQQHLLHQLRENSQFLELQKENLTDVLENLDIVSFYETKSTPAVTKSPESGQYSRNGEVTRMVQNMSALLFLKHERRIVLISL